MMWVALLSRPWILALRGLHVVPRVLADDFTLCAAGPEQVACLVDALNFTHVFVRGLGGRISPLKSALFATTAAVAVCGLVWGS